MGEKKLGKRDIQHRMGLQGVAEKQKGELLFLRNSFSACDKDSMLCNFNNIGFCLWLHSLPGQQDRCCKLSVTARIGMTAP